MSHEPKKEPAPMVGAGPPSKRRFFFWLICGGIVLTQLRHAGTGWAASASAAGSISVTCDFQSPQLAAEGETTRVTISQCDQIWRPDEPVLPYRTIRLLLPPGAEVVAVTAESVTEPVEIPIELPVAVGGSPVPTPNLPPSATPKSHLTQSIPNLTSSALYPASPVELVSVQQWGGNDIAMVRVYPVQYLPAAATLVFRSQLRVVLSLRPSSAQSELPLHPPGGADRALGQVAAMVDNPAAAAATARPGVVRANSAAACDYLLITKSNLVTAFQPLVDRKLADGLAVQVVTVETIKSTFPGRDDAEKIRNYIRYAYTNSGITYVLLGGDTPTVPCRYGYAYMGALTTDYLVPTDLYFACLDGSWDGNGNNIFGEPTDGPAGGEVDLLAEVYVGRAPVDTPTEVSVFVEKQVRYETQTHPRATNVLFMAEYLGSSGSGPSQGWDMFVPLLPYFTNRYEIARLDDAPATTPQWTATNALTAMNASPHLALFNGHGDTDAMMRLFTEDVDWLTNQWLFLNYSVGCNAGEFDNDVFSPDCIGEELVKQHSRGAFAAILNSRLGWYDPQNEWRWSGEFQIQFFRELLTNGHPRLGVANQLSKHAMISQVETSGLMTYRWCYFEITLFGDPHVAWQSPPVASPLVVASVHGGAAPPVGTNQFASGSLVSCAVTNSPLAAGGGTQYVCTGWTGTGSVPASGTLTQVNLTLTADSQINWTWKTQVWFAASSSGAGFITPANSWRDLDSGLVIQATASNYYHFLGWTGDVPNGMQSNSTLNLTMNQPRTLLASFAENRTSNGTPEWWLASYGWTNQFETAALADSDNDGLPAWQEYVAGTSPVDGNSNLRLELTQPGGVGSGKALRWASVSNRWYSVSRASAPEGIFYPLTNGIPGTPPWNTFIDLTPGEAAFYRLGVTNSP